MLLVAKVAEARRVGNSDGDAVGLDKLKEVRSTLPAVTHVDHSARVQTVSPEDDPRFHSLIKRFGDITGSPVLINTSFNVRGEPIVCTPEDAFNCFMRTGMDHLVIENFMLDKAQQDPSLIDSDQEWQQEYPLD